MHTRSTFFLVFYELPSTDESCDSLVHSLYQKYQETYTKPINRTENDIQLNVTIIVSVYDALYVHFISVGMYACWYLCMLQLWHPNDRKMIL